MKLELGAAIAAGVDQLPIRLVPPEQEGIADLEDLDLLARGRRRLAVGFLELDGFKAVQSSAMT